MLQEVADLPRLEIEYKGNIDRHCEQVRVHPVRF
jgi:hypothetical protein